MTKMRSFILLVFAVSLGSCCWIAPRTCELEAIHELYREEFPSAVLPDLDEESGEPEVKLDAGFQRTLAAIDEFQKRYGQDSREAAHLLVLKGMIYLQSGRPSMARLLADDIEKAESRLISGTGVMARDSLFAAAFDALVDGWEQIAAYKDDSDTTIAEYEALDSAVRGIDTVLKDRDRKIAGADIDDGAIYLANTAAIFKMWAYAIGSSTETPETSDDPLDMILEPSDRPIFAAFARDLIGRYLSEGEKKAAVAASFGTLASSQSGRMRYLAWYRALDALAKAPPAE